MDLTDVPDVRAPDEEAPAFSELDDPVDVVTAGPVRERLLDVVVQLRSPTKVATIAERASCDEGTARNYLEWFASMGIVREHGERPVRYERNDSYLRWRRVERLRADLTEAEIVDELAAVVDAIETYREEFGVDDPDDVSLLDADRDVASVWEDVSRWKTLERRAELLDEARRASGSGDVGAADV